MQSNHHVKNVNGSYNHDLYIQLVGNTKQACASIGESKKPVIDRYILHINGDQQLGFIQQVVLQDLLENHSMIDTNVRLPFDDAHKQSVTQMYLDLMQLKKYKILTGVNTFDVRSTRTYGTFPPFPDSDDEEDTDNEDLDKNSSDEDEDME
jgi:hypothetical protein